MTRPLALAYVTGLYGRASDTFIREEVAALRDLGHRVDTFSIRRPREVPVDTAVEAERRTTEYVLERGLPSLALETARWAGRRPGATADAARLAARVTAPGARGRLWPAAYLVEAAYLARRLEELGTDHLHDHIAEGSGAVAMMASAMAGVPFSITVHGPEEFERASRLALDVKAERAAFIAAISDYAREQLSRWVRPGDRGKVQVVRCGVPGWLIERAPTAPAGARRLVSVGRLEAAKGHRVMIDAIARLLAAGEEPFEVVIAGDGPLRAELEARIRSLGIEGSVRLVGRRGHREVIQLLDAARALVMPSFAEGLPVTIMESLAVGRPVVATAIAGVPELVSDGRQGWLVPPGSVDALAEAMRAALAAPVADLERMGLAGAALVAERHDGRRQAAQLAELFSASAAGHGR